MAHVFELAASINKKGAFRLIRDATSMSEIKDFVKTHPGENLYFSVYKFRLTVKNIPIYDSAVLDKLFVEIDSDGHSLLNHDAWKDLQRLLDWCKRESLPGKEIVPEIYFSGGSGYHIIFSLPEEMPEISNSRVVQKLTEKIKALSGSRIDMQANNGFSQLRRIPNTQHQKTGLYCIPLTIDEAYNCPPEKIMEFAKKPRRTKIEYAPSPYFLDVIRFVNDVLKKNAALRERNPDETKHLNHLAYVASKQVKEHQGTLRPCIMRMMEKENPNFNESTWICCEMLAAGYNDNDIIEYFKMIRGKNFDYNMTTYQLRKLKEKGIFPPSCITLEVKGLCKPEYHGFKGPE